MTDLSALSDSQLQALYSHADTPDLSKMSDADLLAAYHGPVGTGEDIAKTALPSVGRLVAGTAGTPGDASNFLAKGSQIASDYIASKLGIDPGPRASGPVLPTSAGIEKAIEPYTGNYQPQTFGGKVFDKAVQFAPGLIGGPETLATKALTRVAAPAVASQVGEDVGGPVGGVVGALAGAAGASKVAQFKAAAKAASQAAKSVPEGEQLLKTGGDQFNQARDMNVVVKPDFATNTAADMRTALKDFDPEDASVKDVFRKIDRLESMGGPETINSAATNFEGKIFPGINHGESTTAAAKSKGMTLDDFMDDHTDEQAQQGFLTSSGRFVDRNEALKIANKADQVQPESPDTKWWNQGKPGLLLPGGLSTEVMKAPARHGVQMNDIENVRKQLSQLRMSPDASTRAAAKTAQKVLTDNQMALTGADVLSGDAPLYSQTMKDAVGNYAAGKRSQTIQGKMNLAELNANTPVGMLDSAAGGQALQRTMKQLARPANNTNVPIARKLGFNNQEIAAINEAASGTKMTHAAELMDRLIPAKLGAIPAMVARQIGGLTTKRQVSALDSLVRSKSPLAAQVAAQLPPQIVQQLPAKTTRLLRAMILADPTISQQDRDAVSQTQAYQPG